MEQPISITETKLLWSPLILFRLATFKNPKWLIPPSQVPLLVTWRLASPPPRRYVAGLGKATDIVDLPRDESCKCKPKPTGVCFAALKPLHMGLEGGTEIC